MKFSLFFFSSNSLDSNDVYGLLRHCALYADEHDFYAVWIPERHFHSFGALYPNPSVLGAALSVLTERLQIRAGSVVMPLHHPLRVAEEWSVVDNLSNGRAGLSFASGWHPYDFVLSPGTYGERKRAMMDGIATVRRLWRGEAISFPNGLNAESTIQIYPKPISADLPVWLTSSLNIDTWIEAAKIGANVLTALLGQSIHDVEQKIAAYRQARALHGHDPDAGQVTLMLHTFVGDDMDSIRRSVKTPLINYLRTHLNLQEAGDVGDSLQPDVDRLTEHDRELILERAFQQYFDKGTLFGTPEVCAEIVDRLAWIGVDEIGCFIDFGMSEHETLEGLKRLSAFKTDWNARRAR